MSKKLIVAIGSILVGLGFWQVQRSETEFERFVETPGADDPVVFRNPGTPVKRVSPDIDFNDEESIVRWPRYTSKDGTVPPLTLRIKRENWYRGKSDSVAQDRWVIAPWRVLLNIDWPLAEGEQAKRRGRNVDQPPPLELDRIPSFATTPENSLSRFREPFYRRAIKYISPLGTPEGQMVVVHCYGDQCFIRFTHHGRSVRAFFGVERAATWRTGYDSAIKLLNEITEVSTK